MKESRGGWLLPGHPGPPGDTGPALGSQERIQGVGPCRIKIAGPCCQSHSKKPLRTVRAEQMVSTSRSGIRKRSIKLPERWVKESHTGTLGPDNSSLKPANLANGVIRPFWPELLDPELPSPPSSRELGLGRDGGYPASNHRIESQ